MCLCSLRPHLYSINPYVQQNRDDWRGAHSGVREQLRVREMELEQLRQDARKLHEDLEKKEEDYSNTKQMAKNYWVSEILRLYA